MIVDYNHLKGNTNAEFDEGFEWYDTSSKKRRHEGKELDQKHDARTKKRCGEDKESNEESHDENSKENSGSAEGRDSDQDPDDETPQRSQLDIWAEDGQNASTLKLLHRLLKHIERTAKDQANRGNNRFALRQLRRADEEVGIVVPPNCDHLIVDLVSPKTVNDIETAGMGDDHVAKLGGHVKSDYIKGDIAWTRTRVLGWLAGVYESDD